MDIWLPFFYHYGVGGAVFVLSLIVLIAAGALRPAEREDRRLLVAMVGGLALFIAGHALWISLVST
ncbi:MAG: hypothetical protein KF708_19660 [Pirellulales bacterium]|nr:hypothetical protein [Pirellulales bacterium]